MKKLIKKLDKTFIAARLRFGELMSKEDGMETLETVIVIILAIVVAGVVITALGDSSDKNTVLGKIFDKINTGIDNIFNGKKANGG